MHPLHYSRPSALLGSIGGRLACLSINIVFRLPNAALLPLLALVERVLLSLGGQTPATRAVKDLRFIFSRGGESADNLRRLLTRSRPEEIVSFVRGAVIRSLP